MKWVLFAVILFCVLFLISRSVKSGFVEPKLYIIISTCKNYREKTIPPLLKNLEDAGVPSDRIVVISGGEDTEDDRNVKYQFWELTGLIWLASQPDKGDYYFMMHDTCSVEPHFWESLNKKFTEMGDGSEAMRLMENNGKSSMNMGIYKHSYLISRKEELDSLKSYPQDEKDLLNLKAFGLTVEGKFLTGFPLMYGGDETKIIYGDDQKCINKIPSLGFTKVQTNCGRGPLKMALS